MPLLSDWLTVFAVGFVVVITPGANFAITLRNSLVYSRSSGVYTAVGVTLGGFVHVAYCLLGIGVIISRSILLFNALKWLGAIYLIYLGLKSLRAKPRLDVARKSDRTLSRWAAIRIGLLTSLLNPKATLLYLAVFTQIIEPNSPLPAQIIYGLTVVGLEILWYGAVALFISLPTVKELVTSVAHWVERGVGAVLILLGVRLAIACDQN